MTIYQKEFARRLAALGCTGQVDENSGMLNVSMDCIPLCIIGKTGDIYWDRENLFSAERKKALDELCRLNRTVREYVSLYEAAPQMKTDGVKDYRLLSEYRSTVLGAMYSEKYGFMFSTWSKCYDGSSVTMGDYSPNYEYAKESFITRSGLADKNRLFTPEEAENLYRCVDFVKDNCETLTYEQEQQLKDLMEKLTYGYPQIEDNPPSFEPSDSPQLNM